jgi:hypothetical protein
MGGIEESQGGVSGDVLERGGGMESEGGRGHQAGFGVEAKQPGTAKTGTYLYMYHQPGKAGKNSNRKHSQPVSDPAVYFLRSAKLTSANQ